MEQLLFTRQDKAGRYEELLPQIQSLIENESDAVANLANIAAALKETFGWWWVGFYLVRDRADRWVGDPVMANGPIAGEDIDGTLRSGEPLRLVLGPFQGPVACTSIAKGRGVCGAAWKEAKTQIVPDVDAFPGHIACSSASKSEIVVPLLHQGCVWGVLDVDSEFYATFDSVDAEYLEKLNQQICKFIK